VCDAAAVGKQRLHPQDFAGRQRRHQHVDHRLAVFVFDRNRLPGTIAGHGLRRFERQRARQARIAYPHLQA